MNLDDKFRFRIRYPWLTLLLAIITLFYVQLMWQPGLWEWLLLPEKVINRDYFSLMVLVFLAVAWRDFRVFRGQQHKLRRSVEQLWSNKRELQLKAQTSASHTDKLKLFISDKLLEYIEYDEKFLHFKSIASEVRHNGVISFDKVQSALLYARDHSLPDEQGSQATLYQEALVGMRYLWDLLDLSTADNMALHIGNHITECEEQIFAAELQQQDLSQLPTAPSFSPRQAIIDALTLHLGVELYGDGEQTFGSWAGQVETDQPLQLRDAQGLFRVELGSCDSLLGNANHLVLMLENLLRNAQYYAGKRQYKSPFPGISVRLNEQQQYLNLSIYNRGPHITPEQQSQLFKLGYSTRRVKEHNGKGLGLYFVQQIAQGFDGVVSVNNIDNERCDYHLRLEFDDGEVRNQTLQQTLDNGQVMLQLDEGPGKSWQAQFERPIRSIEVQQHGQEEISRLQPDGQCLSWFDPLGGPRPRWQLTVSGRNANKLSFTPLDCRGVEFQVRMPTLSGRLDGIPALDDGPDVAKLSEHFQSPDDF